MKNNVVLNYKGSINMNNLSEDSEYIVRGNCETTVEIRLYNETINGVPTEEYLKDEKNEMKLKDAIICSEIAPIEKILFRSIIELFDHIFSNGGEVYRETQKILYALQQSEEECSKVHISNIVTPHDTISVKHFTADSDINVNDLEYEVAWSGAMTGGYLHLWNLGSYELSEKQPDEKYVIKYEGDPVIINTVYRKAGKASNIKMDLVTKRNAFNGKCMSICKEYYLGDILHYKITMDPDALDTTHNYKAITSKYYHYIGGVDGNWDAVSYDNPYEPVQEVICHMDVLYRLIGFAPIDNLCYTVNYETLAYEELTLVSAAHITAMGYDVKVDLYPTYGVILVDGECKSFKYSSYADLVNTVLHVNTMIPAKDIANTRNKNNANPKITDIKDVRKEEAPNITLDRSSIENEKIEDVVAITEEKEKEVQPQKIVEKNEFAKPDKTGRRVGKVSNTSYYIPIKFDVDVEYRGHNYTAYVDLDTSASINGFNKYMKIRGINLRIDKNSNNAGFISKLQQFLLNNEQVVKNIVSYANRNAYEKKKCDVKFKFGSNRNRDEITIKSLTYYDISNKPTTVKEFNRDIISHSLWLGNRQIYETEWVEIPDTNTAAM